MGSTCDRNRNISLTVSTTYIYERSAGTVVTVFLLPLEDKLGHRSNLVVPCALVLHWGNCGLDENSEYLRSPTGFRES